MCAMFCAMLLNLLRYATAIGMMVYVGAMTWYIGGSKQRTLSVDGQRNRWKRRFCYSAVLLRYQIIPVTGATILFFVEDADNMLRYGWLAGPVMYVIGHALTKLKETPFLLEQDVESKKGDKWIRRVMGLWESRQRTKRSIDIFTVLLYCVLAVSGCGTQQITWIEYLEFLLSMTTW